MKTFFAAASGIAIAIAAPARLAAQEAPTIEVPAIDYDERVLDNGLRVISIKDETTPNVYVSMWYEVGGKHDPDGRSGFAHLFEHILSRKTENIPYADISRMVDDVGGSRNASTWFDRTNYYEIVPAEYLERMLWTHAERMARPVVDQEVFEAERSIVKEEFRQRYLAQPYGLSTLATIENVFSTLPSRRAVIGSIEDLDNASLEDALAFHEAYYGPDTATLIVAGNFTQDRLDALVDRYFADIPRRANPLPIAIDAQPTPLTGSRRVTVTAPNTPLPQAIIAWQMPPAGHEDIPALTVLDTILSTGDNDRLTPALIKTGLATGAGSGLGANEDASYFQMVATASSGTEAEALFDAMDRVIADIAANGPTAAEMAEAKNSILSSTLSSRETAIGRAQEIGETLVRTGDAAAADRMLQASLGVTAADVQRVARQYLRRDARVELVLTDGEFDPAGWANPVALPTFITPPPASRAPLALLPEGERMAAPEPGAEPDVPRPELERATLSNGIDVIVGETGDVPVATMAIILEGGSAADPRGKAGRAAFAAAMAEKGIPGMSAEQIAARFESLGASFGGGSGAEATYFTVRAPVATLAEAASLAGRIIAGADYPQDEFARERKRRLDGLRVQLGSPGGVAGTIIAPFIYGDAPYGIVGGGTPDSIAGLERDDLLAFREAYWRPENATVIIGGGIDAGQAQAIAETALGDWQASGAPGALPERYAGEMLPRRTLVVDQPGAGQAAVYAVARGLSRDNPAFYAAELVNAELGGSGTARLYNEVRAKRGLSYGAYSSVSARRDEGFISASSQTKNESASEVAKLLVDEMTRIGTEGVDAEVLDRRRVLLTGRFERGLETSSGFVNTVAGAIIDGMSPEQALTYGDRIEMVDAASAPAVFARYIDPSRVSLLIVGDADMFIDDLREWRPGVEVIAAEDLDLATAR